jgi:uncharacterized protein with PQ loop repeat
LIPLYVAVGLMAGFLIALGLVPEVISVWRQKDASEISLLFTLLSLGGAALWFLYGYILALVTIMLWNGINFALWVALLAMKLRYESEKRRSSGLPHMVAPDN